jgi:thermostable 8-oxoguanine DNA glycosylase
MGSTSSAAYTTKSESRYSLGEVDGHIKLVCTDKRNVNMTKKTVSAKQYFRNGEVIRLIQTDGGIETGRWALVVITSVKTLGGFVYGFEEI